MPINLRYAHGRDINIRDVVATLQRSIHVDISGNIYPPALAEYFHDLKKFHAHRSLLRL
jgi:hypothetical protein